MFEFQPLFQHKHTSLLLREREQKTHNYTYIRKTNKHQSIEPIIKNKFKSIHFSLLQKWNASLLATAR